ncbi:MAG: hypothetical protein GFH27_549347n53 [Chloroflexi bacterium AL-W]|nr:hypothetical protein [Chloroflexi bacterium AL-N1]NOK70835.1 hypothetical protein [Chloroflexi bacterium AL-N10]NOK78395.1 hypothetical protein [Chloroflexi bacterium AL-N5]NOK85376.1 hypothetical protein [Chloroflexi bacterium AL-W]NOK92652.1 hypothetical protein [Chloroflexi bacterium AL-N15]
MRNILLTGMSGTGKSSVIGILQERGYRAVDMDEPGWSVHDADGHQLWCEDRLQEDLTNSGETILFVSGCAENQGKFYSEFRHIILLSAPAEVLIERLTHRTNNPYGKRPEERAEVLHYLETVEPLLRGGATHEIDTTQPLEQVVEMILTLALEEM